MFSLRSNFQIGIKYLVVLIIKVLASDFDSFSLTLIPQHIMKAF